MWALIIAAETSGGVDWRPYVIPGVLSLAAAGLTAWLALRGTFKQASTTHEVEFDKLVHARVVELEKQVAARDSRIEVLTADRDRYREMHAQLRLDIRAAGLNPDRLGKAVDDG